MGILETYYIVTFLVPYIEQDVHMQTYANRLLDAYKCNYMDKISSTENLIL